MVTPRPQKKSSKTFIQIENLSRFHGEASLQLDMGVLSVRDRNVVARHGKGHDVELREVLSDIRGVVDDSSDVGASSSDQISRASQVRQGSREACDPTRLSVREIANESLAEGCTIAADTVRLEKGFQALHLRPQDRLN